MKRIAMALICLSLLMVWGAACTGKSDYQIYEEAVERTEKVPRGKSEMEMAMSLKFNKDGLTEQIADGLELFENMNFVMREEYDRDKRESLKKIFARVKDAGIDAKIYTRGDISYIITPLIPKIVVIKGEDTIYPNAVRTNEEALPALSQESIESIAKVWESLYNDDNVSALEKIVLDTPEGSVKATRYEMNMSEEQLKPAIRKTMEIIMRDSQFMATIEDMMKKAIEEYVKADIPREDFSAEDFSVEKMFKANMETVNNSTIRSFAQTAYIDRDNYVIEENMSMDILFHFTEAGTPSCYKLNMSIKNWDLNREPAIYFPEVNSENSITPDQLKEEYSDIFCFEKGEDN